MNRLTPRVKRILLALCVILLTTFLLLVYATQALASFRLDYIPGVEPSDGIRVLSVHQVVPNTEKKAVVAVEQPPRDSGPSGDIWDCIAAKESGNRPLPCRPFCGRLQWLPSTWRAAGGTRYAPLPQQATYAQEVEIARAWLKKTSWRQWPNTSRMCGVR